MRRTSLVRIRSLIRSSRRIGQALSVNACATISDILAQGLKLINEERRRHRSVRCEASLPFVLHDSPRISIPADAGISRISSPSLTDGTGRSGCLADSARSEEHTSELQSPCNLVCRLLLEKKKTKLSGG